MGIAIRPATLADAEPLARLMTELGYPTSSRQMERRLTSILGDVSYRTFVACDGDAIVGVIGTRVGPMYEIDEPYGQNHGPGRLGDASAAGRRRAAGPRRRIPFRASAAPPCQS